MMQFRNSKKTPESAQSAQSARVLNLRYRPQILIWQPAGGQHKFESEVRPVILVIFSLRSVMFEFPLSPLNGPEILTLKSRFTDGYDISRSPHHAGCRSI